MQRHNASQRKEKSVLDYTLISIILFLYFVITPIADIFAQLGYSIFRSCFKIPYLLFVLLAFALIIKYNRLNISLESLLFMFFMPFAFTIGIIEHGFNNYFASHFYTALIPILGISTGLVFSRKYGKLDKAISRCIALTFYCMLILIPVYYLMYVAGMIRRFGFTAQVSLVSSYFLVKQKYWFFFACMMLALLTGKRAAIVLIVVQIFIWIWYLIYTSSSKISLKNLKNVFLILLVFLVFSGIVINFGNQLVRNFKTLQHIDLTDKKMVSTITSGRLEYLTSFIDHFNESKRKWLFGGGFGETYELHLIAREETEVVGYAHAGLPGYTLIYGGIFSVILYFDFFFLFIRGLLYHIDKYEFLVFTIYFISSFIGATILVDPFFWFFLGVLRGRTQGRFRSFFTVNFDGLVKSKPLQKF